MGLKTRVAYTESAPCRTASGRCLRRRSDLSARMRGVFVEVRNMVGSGLGVVNYVV